MHDVLLALRTKRPLLRRSLKWDSEDRTELQPFTSAGPCPFWHLGTCSFVHCIFARKMNAETTTPITPRELEPSERILWRGHQSHWPTFWPKGPPSSAQEHPWLVGCPASHRRGRQVNERGRAGARSSAAAGLQRAGRWELRRGFTLPLSLAWGGFGARGGARGGQRAGMFRLGRPLSDRPALANPQTQPGEPSLDDWPPPPLLPWHWVAPYPGRRPAGGMGTRSFWWRQVAGAVTVAAMVTLSGRSHGRGKASVLTLGGQRPCTVTGSGDFCRVVWLRMGKDPLVLRSV